MQAQTEPNGSFCRHVGCLRAGARCGHKARTFLVEDSLLEAGSSLRNASSLILVATHHSGLCTGFGVSLFTLRHARSWCLVLLGSSIAALLRLAGGLFRANARLCRRIQGSRSFCRATGAAPSCNCTAPSCNFHRLGRLITSFLLICGKELITGRVLGILRRRRKLGIRATLLAALNKGIVFPSSEELSSSESSFVATKTLESFVSESLESFVAAEALGRRFLEALNKGIALAFPSSEELSSSEPSSSE